MQYLGLDLSLTASGWASCGPGLTDARSGVIKPQGNLRGVSRLSWLADQLGELLETEGPMVIAIEDYAMGAKGRTFDIGEWGGLAKFLCLRRNDPTVALTVPPKTLKMFATENGNASKPDMIAASLELFGLETKDDNQADAMALACVCCAWNEGRNFKGRQKEAMAKIYPCFPIPFRPKGSRHRPR